MTHLSQIIPVDGDGFDPRKICSTKHDYHLHPLMQIEALEALAGRLVKEEKCRVISPSIKIDSPFDHFAAPDDGKFIKDLFKGIEIPGTWIALYDVQTDSAYKDFLDGVSNNIQHLVQKDQSVNDVRAFIFISAPPSVTPFHIDRENNFWLQIRGTKRLTVWDHRDRSAVAARDVEQFLLYGDLENVSLNRKNSGNGISFDCKAGDGIYFPMTTPHMTESRTEWMGGETLTISIGMVFYSNVTRRHTRVNMLNHIARSCGVNLSPPGKSDTKDAIKAVFGRMLWEIWKRRKAIR